MRRLSGVLGSYCRVGLGPTKRPGPKLYNIEKGAYNISPTTKNFRPRKIRLTITDVGMNSSCPPQAPK